MAFRKKFIQGGILDIDKATKSVKVAISSMDTVDRDKEIIGLKAWDATIKSEGPKGLNQVWHMIDHGGDGMPSLTRALSKFKELSIEGSRLVGVSEYRDTALWRDHMWPLYESEDINQHSASFIPQKSRWVSVQGERVKHFDQNILLEGSAVLWGAHPDTPTIAITLGKRLGLIDDDMSLTAKMGKLIKSLKSESLSEDSKTFLLIELMKMQQSVKQMEKPRRLKSLNTNNVDWDRVALELALDEI